MTYFKCTKASEGVRISYYWEVASRESSTAKFVDDDGSKDHHHPPPHKTDYEMLPRHLKSCLDYCALLHNLRDCDLGIHFHAMFKERIASLMVAEGLIEENASSVDDSSKEDFAFSLLDELVGRGMLLQYFDSHYFRTIIEIPEANYKLCVIERDEDEFVARNANTPISVSIKYYYDTDISPHLNNLPIQSLFFCGRDRFSYQTAANTIFGLKSVLVLQLEGWVDDHILFNKIGELINLKFLSLSVSSISVPSSEITQSLSNCQLLQTLELFVEGWTDNKVFEEVATIRTLRHLSCQPFQRRDEGFGRLVNLQTLVGWNAGSEVTDELSSLNQLRRLHVEYVADENAEKLLQTITPLRKLVSLSMTTEFYNNETYGHVFPLLEHFLPPPDLQELRLKGTLLELPDWIFSIENLTTLVLSKSYLSEYPSTTFQSLPNLKFLSLDSAYQAEFIGREFCEEGGFPKLEKLEITSKFLVGWHEIGEGAFPCLRSFTCHGRGMKFFPEGIQYISTLERLQLFVHEDLIRRLNSDENYKIKQIPFVYIKPKQSYIIYENSNALLLSC